MQITATSTSGLKREFKVAFGAGDIDALMNEKLKTLGQRVQLPGFRRGKAPVSLLKKQYGPSLMGEVLEECVSKATAQAIKENDLRPALQPKIEVTKFDEKEGLEYTMAVEVIPEITMPDFRTLAVEKAVCPVNDTMVDEAIQKLAEGQKDFADNDAGRAAQKGDAVKIDFLGKKDGVAFQGGSAEGYTLELGSGMFIPGFEDQLIGAKAGAKVEVNVTFPENYGNADLAGQPAVFDVTVHEVRAPKPVVIDDELAKRFGLEGLDALKKAVRDQMDADMSGMSRAWAKRKLLDALAEGLRFELPATMVEQEFSAIWNQIKETPGALDEEMKSSGKSEADLEKDYREIAERRVRLGLLLAEVGRLNNIDVKPEEMSQAVMNEARRFPGQEKQVFDYFRKNPEAMARLRAPLFEDKVVDFVLEMAKITEKAVDRDTLVNGPDSEGK